jgi:hypothetical protein
MDDKWNVVRGSKRKRGQGMKEGKKEERKITVTQ